MTARAKKKGGGIGGNIKFLALVLLLYGLLALFRPDIVRMALANFGQMLTKVIPVLAMVFVVMVLTNLWLKPEAVRRHFGHESGFKGWFYAVLAGLVVFGPPYVLFPMLADLRRHGARNALLAVFLYNRNVNVQFVPAMICYFGLRYTLVLSCYIILFSIVSGLVTELLAPTHPLAEERPS